MTEKYDTRIKKKNAFTKWLAKYSVEEIAKKLDVSPRSVIRWRMGFPPELKPALHIIMLSKGEVTPKDILKHSSKK